MICHNKIDKSLSHISQSVKRNAHTNVFTATAPHHYDSVASSKVNQEAQIFNRKFKKYIYEAKYSTILETEHDRKYF
jgi:hypothetical protein